MVAVSYPLIDSSYAHRQRLSLGVAGSILVHALLGWFLVRTPSSFHQPIPLPLTVSIATLPEVRKDVSSPEPIRKQIVSEPLSPVAPPPRETTRLAERDHRAEREQIARGTGNEAVVRPGRPPSSRSAAPQPVKSTPEKLKGVDSQRTSNRPEREQSAPSVRPEERPQQKAPRVAQRSVTSGTLRLDSDAILSRFGQKVSNQSTSGGAGQKAAAESDSSNARLDAALSAPSGSGTADKLSGVHDGTVTLLNAKADKYAVFVRRVAYRVFSSLRGSGWHSLSAGHIRAIGQPVVVIAELSPQGAFLSVRVRQPSGSPRFDALVSAAVQRSVSDPNPPSGAIARDGRIRFIFQSTSTVSIGPGGPQGFPAERRWLELGTGLD